MTAAIPGIPTVEATTVAAPPGWALIQRNVIEASEEGAALMVEKYTERGGGFYFADCVDDFYERYVDWGLFYAIGGGDDVLDSALNGWNAITRTCDDSVFHRAKHPEYYHGALRKWVPQLHNEYFNLATMSGAGSAEWHHLGEANMAFYHFGLADPTISENVRRARKFAAMHMGDDADAPNYDPEHKLFRSPIQTSEGPCVDGTVDRAIWWLQGLNADSEPAGPMTAAGRRATLYPVVKELEVGWQDDPDRRDKIVELFEKIVLRGDTPQSLAATALMANAYMYTGEDRYRRWVLDYADGWMDRLRRNGGIIPDNVGPSGIIGEHRDGQWWGGLYGWSSRGLTNIFNSITVGAECALLLTGDFGYLELVRSQLELLLANSKTLDNGQLAVPYKHGPDGWVEFAPMRLKEPAHLYHASMDANDFDLIKRLRDGDVEEDWNEVSREEEKARFQFYDGKNPGWPEKVLRADYQAAVETLQKMHSDTRDADQLIADNTIPTNPVVTRGLIQTTLGTPLAVYNGGLLRATVRYFDPDRVRPGMPPDVAALVDELSADRVGIQLVNLSQHEMRNVIVQAGAFGEHEFTDVRYQNNGAEAATAVDGKFLAVSLPPSTTVRIGVGMRRFENQPTYAFPWHGDTIHVPFQ